MERSIIVAGAGHGGIVAATYLAQAGYRVTVYEKKQEAELGYPQQDSIHLDGFELSGVPVPEAYRVKRTPIAFQVLGTDLPPIVQGDAGETYNVEIDRKALYRHLIGPAKEAGVRFCFGVEIRGPVMLGSRVVGVETDAGRVYADLVIDAAGLYSPVRSNLPAFLEIEKDPGKFDMLHAYRAYFSLAPDAPAPEHKYLVSILPGEFCGILWAITNEDHVDVLIGSMYELTDEGIEDKLALLRACTPQLGDTLLHGGRTPDIPIRQPLSLMVADGYAAIGDAAFMTVPLKGSGIGYSMRAGKLLAECVIADENGEYTRETLWNYQFDYFEQIGFSAATVAVVKAVFPFLTVDDVEYVFRENLITSADLEMFGNEAGLFKILTSMRLRALTDKAKKIVGHPNARRLLLDIGRNVVRLTRIKAGLKERPDRRAVSKWVRAYTAFYESIKEMKPEDKPRRAGKKETPDVGAALFDEGAPAAVETPAPPADTEGTPAAPAVAPAEASAETPAETAQAPAGRKEAAARRREAAAKKKEAAARKKEAAAKKKQSAAKKPAPEEAQPAPGEEEPAPAEQEASPAEREAAPAGEA